MAIFGVGRKGLDSGSDPPAGRSKSSAVKAKPPRPRAPFQGSYNHHRQRCGHMALESRGPRKPPRAQTRSCPFPFPTPLGVRHLFVSLLPRMGEHVWLREAIVSATEAAHVHVQHSVLNADS